MKHAAIITLAVIGVSGWLSAATLMVEAESFAEKGGWVVDPQFMEQMGSPFLMAHGLGIPVADASTLVDVPEAGSYRVWVRTRNWAAYWTQMPAPGQFRVALDGETLDTVLGTQGAEWAWQQAGTVALGKGKRKLALHDLTGFNGRCDAIILTTDAVFKPHNDVVKLEGFRRAMGTILPPRETRHYDLVVVGGGIPGICAAITAARLGLSVVLVQDRPVLGGNNSSEIRVPLGGRINQQPYPKLGEVVKEIGPARGAYAGPAALYEDRRKLDAVKAEPNITLCLNTRGVAVEMEGEQIAAVIARHVETGVETRLAAPLVLDSTGDGAIGALAGAEFRMGRESREETGEKSSPEQADRLTMGSTVQWSSSEAKEALSFPDIRWGLAITDTNCERVRQGGWQWETGMDRHQVDEFERIRDYGLLAVFSNWAFLKNRSASKADYEKSRLEWVAFVAGKRESRRLIGDYVLNGRDMVERKVFSDATACTTWTVDLHYPEPKNAENFPGNAFKSIATHHATIYPYPIPYRCLYSKNVKNLFMAGRNISATHVALGSARVMRTGGMMGEVVGMAASLCKRNACGPREVYTAHFEELKVLMAKGAGLGREQPPQNYTLGRTLLKRNK